MGNKLPGKKSSGFLTLEEKKQIEVLIANGDTYHSAAVKIGRDHKTVKAYATSPEAAEAIRELRGELADMYTGLARRMLDSITDEDIKKLDAYRRTVASGIATDKARLLGGLSTVNLFNFTRLVEDGDAIEIRRFRGELNAGVSERAVIEVAYTDAGRVDAECEAAGEVVPAKKKRGRRKPPAPTSDAEG